MRTSLLERVARQEDPPGALLLTGGDAEGLDREARRLAARLLCPEEDAELRCSSCRRALDAIHPDLLLVEPEGVAIRIDRIREARAFAAGRPYESARRVAVVSQADQLGLEAANALLKSLEEPGSKAHWILTTTRPDSLLSTIRSRCVAVPVGPPPLGARVRQWRSRGFSEEDAADLALFAAGDDTPVPEKLESARENRSLLLSALHAGLVERKLAALILLAERLAKAERAESNLLAALLADAALLSSGASPESLRHRAAAGHLRELAVRLTPRTLREAALRAADAPADSRRGNLRLHFEGVLLGLWLEAAGSA